MKVRIDVDPGQTLEEAEELLFKALSSHREGEPHSKGVFSDPAMEDSVQRLNSIYDKLAKNMLREINEVLDEEYPDGD